MRAYHFLSTDMTASSGNEPPWRVGETRRMPKGAPIMLCHSGYHSSPTPWPALYYESGTMLCLVDVSTPRDKQDGDKQVSFRRTLVQVVDVTRTLHEIAVRIALDVLPLYERQYPTDMRLREAIEAKQKWLRGEIGDAQLDIAWVAARDVARAANSAWIAAEDAADALGAVAGSAEDAAGDAADALGVAAQAAEAVWVAAGDANVSWIARTVAWVAAQAAARVAMVKKYHEWGNDALVAALAAQKEGAK